MPSCNLRITFAVGLVLLTPGATSAGKCLECHSTDSECMLGTAAVPTVDCPATDDRCITAYEGGLVVRGCLANIPDGRGRRSCENPEDGSCYVCSGNRCNSAAWLRCHFCSVTLEDTFCTGQLDVNDSGMSVYCQNYNDRCYTRIVGEYFQRGCDSYMGHEVAGCTNLNKTQCRLCSGDNCNNISLENLRSSSAVIGVSSMLLMMQFIVVMVKSSMG